MSDSSATEVAFQAFSRLDEVHVEANLSPESKTFLVVGPLAAVKAFIARDGLSLGDANAVVVALAESLTASTDKPKTVETRVMVGDGLKRVVLSALPTACSRHNSPAHPLGTKKAVSGAGVGKSASIVVLVPSLDYAVAAAAAVGRCFPAYNHTGAQLATGATAAPGVDVHVVVRGSEGDEPDAALRARMQAVVRSVRRAAALVDMPTNALHTDSYVAAAEAVMAELGAGASGSVRMETIRGTALRDGGFGGLWGVGKASEHLPALVRLEHVPEGVAPDAESVVLVGKGIVYDTGGLSIKSKTGMPGMAGDMGGSAGILGAFEAIVRTGGCGKRLVALLCLAENSVSKEATRPDDILHMYSGLTVEINNTDAEGRLVLADGVAYAVRHLNPGVIVDMATLTGAQGISTGQQHAAIYCNTDELEAKARSAGVVSGDLVFPLPYAPEFFRKEFKSVKADMKNSVKNRANAQSSCAGQFIGNHLGDFADTGRWLHVDMAYPSHAEERGTGYGVSLLFHLVQSL